ncbi:MAG TPA: 16S rRNA (uracil(1498)-N(3))-methyltransferase [Candidatus Acidoferrales bacterium]|nr:16S rRNA (uracil(1498)-N(3))-methyltransferase [Candidatus Acidoferrales bacterium]
MAPRFFVDGHYERGEIVAFHGADARKIVTVLRLHSGDQIEVIDSSGRVFAGTLAVHAADVRALLGELITRPSESKLLLTLAQGIPKGQKMDFVVEKATELGVCSIIPFVSERTIGEARGAAKTERWRRLARTAATQCGRTVLPQIEDPEPFAAVLARFTAFDTVLIAWELAEREALRAVLPNVIAGAQRILVMIGPEGGISHAEAHQALAAGAHALSLGARILRTETAGLVACTAILYAAGEL